MTTATINSYDIGDLIRVSAVWTNTAGVAIDPDVVRFKFRTAAADLTTYVYSTDAELVRDSVGNYHVDVSVTNAPGVWNYRFEGETSAGIAQGADEHKFRVSPSKVL